VPLNDSNLELQQVKNPRHPRRQRHDHPSGLENHFQVWKLFHLSHDSLLTNGEMSCRGEIQKAPGSLTEAPLKAEAILFTNDLLTLSLLEQHVPVISNEERDLLLEEEQEADWLRVSQQMAEKLENQRPQTSHKNEFAMLEPDEKDRPFTQAKSRSKSETTFSSLTDSASRRTQHFKSCSPATSSTSPLVFKAKRIKLVILSTWGDKSFAGLNGLEVSEAERSDERSQS